MSVLKKTLCLLLTALLVLPCAVPISVSAEEPVPMKLSIPFEELTMRRGDTQQFIAAAVYSDYSTKVITSETTWISSDSTVVSVSRDGIVTALKATEPDKPVTITASYTEGGVTLNASCEVTVVLPIPGSPAITWTWEKTGLIAGMTYSFAYESGLYEIVPESTEVKTATLTCEPADALEIDNEAKTFKVNPLDGKDTLEVTLTLTADGAGEVCLSATKTMTIYKEIPLKGVSWDFLGGTTTPWYSYYSKEHSKQIEVYYFMPTDKGDRNAAYKWKVYPDNLSRESVLEMCDVTFTSSDPRVITFHVPTGRIIPVGNGTADITIKAVTPDGRIFTDTVTAGVYGAPYTPITDLRIDYDGELDCVVSKGDIPKMSLQYEKDSRLTPVLNNGATFTSPEYSPTMKNGDVLKLVRECDVNWTSDNEDVVTVETNEDGSATVTAVGFGDATVTLKVNDNGEKIVAQVQIHTWESQWATLVRIIVYILTFQWNKLPPTILPRTFFKPRCGGGEPGLF